MLKHRRAYFSALIMTGILVTPVRAQYSNSMGGSPVPGKSPVPGNVLTRSTAPVPGQTIIEKPAKPSTRLIPTRTADPALAANSLYSQLPITLDGAKTKIEELNNLLEVTDRAQLGKIKNNIYAISEWLQDVANAHWRMYKAFDKSPATKLKAKTERETALAFSHLKNRAKLLKADLFIKQKRFPEALDPLVEIVVAEPRSETGRAAYKRLTEMGFSPADKSVEIAASEKK